jgi:predicted lipoprotein with Yx(FWY)xxD motif
MQKSMKVLVPTIAASVVLSACGSSSSSKTSSRAESQAPSSKTSVAKTSSTQVKTAVNTKLGTILVDGRGMTLYHLTAEQNGKFICTSTACLQVWHPLTVQAGATPSGSVGSLATIKRPDGSVQVTYKGQPLYTFAQDQVAGQTNGQGIKDVGTWMAVSAGAGATKAASSTTSGASSSSSSSSESSSSEGPSKGGGYGY